MLVKDAAKQAAQSVLDSHWDGVFPVDPSRIAGRLGIHVQRESLPEDTSGFIMKRKGEDARIFIEAKDSALRQNFTCAHELGHYIERTEVQKVPDEDFAFVDLRHARTHDVHEFFANEFAGNLLMPESEARRLHNLPWDAIRMAAHFGVSIPAMKTRLVKLRLLT